MKLYEAFSARGYHTSLVTTFGIDFDTYESVALPRLRGSGCSNNMVVLDHRMLTLALEATMPPPRFAGRFYTVSGASPSKGVYHPKVLLQIGKTQGRLIVGSANMTASGLAGNLEVAGEVVCDDSDSIEREIVADAWRFALAQLDRAQGTIDRQVRWALERAPWLRSALAKPAVSSPGDIDVAFLATGASVGIAARFVALLRSTPVARLVVVSPYWDDGLEALRYLVDRVGPKQVFALIQKEHRMFPGPAAGGILGLRVVDITKEQGVDRSEGRFVHAKLLIAQAGDADHVLYGSANCTLAAMGNGGFSGTNEEACIYQRLPAGSAIQSLGLEPVLQSAALSSDELNASPAVHAEEIALGDAQLRNPGRFEIDQTTLNWWPPLGAAVETSRIKLLDEGVRPLAIELTVIGKNGPFIRFKLSGPELQPVFALVRWADGTESGKAIITSADRLRQAVRDTRTSAVDRAVADLAEGAEEGLWLLEVIETIDAAERAQANIQKPGDRPDRRIVPAEVGEAAYKQLEYDQFIAGRRAEGDSIKVSRSALASSELSLARSFLNRVLRVDEDRHLDKTLDADTGTELLNAASSDPTDIDGVDASQQAPFRKLAEEESSASRTAAERQRTLKKAAATRREISAAVERFIRQAGEQASADGLSASHALKLRAMLMIVAAAGTPLRERELLGKRKGLSAMQVLPIDGDDGWPKLLGMLLFAFFGHNKGLVKSFRLDGALEQLPDDFLECWATCFWAAHARAQVSIDGRPLSDDPRTERLTRQIYQLTTLRKDELDCETVLKIIAAMSNRLAVRLGISGDRVLQLHSTVAQPAS